MLAMMWSPDVALQLHYSDALDEVITGTSALVYTTAVVLMEEVVAVRLLLVLRMLLPRLLPLMTIGASQI